MKVATNQDRLNELFDEDPRSDTAIANELHVSKQALSAWRKGIRSPKKSVLVQIAEKYKVSIEWLMGFDVEKEAPAAGHPVVIPDTETFRKIMMSLSVKDYQTVMEIFTRAEADLKAKGEL